MSGVGLGCTSLTVRYGPNTAVRDLNFRAPRGRLTGLIGPNGAGKTTTFNACSGLVPAAAGRITLDGRDITGLGPSARARRGLGRTFQRMELFLELSVTENVALGREAGLGGAHPLRQLFRTSKERAQIARATADALHTCGIEDLAGRIVADLSTGQKRLVELARVVAGGFPMLLLDEPSSGLDVAESERFGEVLQRLVAERGVGLLLVEHDMALVMRVCDYLYVLDFGELIFEGTAAQARSDETVRAAYLGTDDRQETANARA